MKKSILFLFSVMLLNASAELPTCLTDHEVLYVSGALKAYNPSTGTVRILHDPSAGVIIDPEVHYDGNRIYFSMRNSDDQHFHIYRIYSSSTYATQITSLEGIDDISPVSMPYSDVAFSSTREPKYSKNGTNPVFNLYFMPNYTGYNIFQISRNEYSENDLSVMPDGRLLYTRQKGDSSSLWTCEPKGTSHALYYGSTNGSTIAQGRAIPGTPYVVCSMNGQISIIDHRLGLYSDDAVIHSWTDAAYTDPYPLVDGETGVGGRYFLCAKNNELYLLDVEGSETLLYTESENITSPMPIAERATPPNLSRYQTYTESDGRFFVLDVYEGTHMEGINRGEVKYLRVIELPEKRTYSESEGWSSDTLQAPAMNWNRAGSARVLGTVPVEEDGSVHFNCPPNTLVSFQLLDENKMMLQSMQSGTIIRPSESYGCIGCHDERTQAPAGAFNTSVPLATMRDPSPLSLTNTFSYMEDIQPIWDDHCLTCHDFGGIGASAVILAADKTLFFNSSYTELLKNGFVTSARPNIIQPPKSWGSHPSALMTNLKGGHGSLNASELEKVAEWLDLNAPYYPEYGSSFPDHLAGRSPLTDEQLTQLGSLTGIDFFAMNNSINNAGTQICFDRPEKSPCLNTLSEPDYSTALTIIQSGWTSLTTNPRPDMPGYNLSDMDVQRDEFYASCRERERVSLMAVDQRAYLYDDQPLLLVTIDTPEGIDGVTALFKGEIIYSVSNTAATITFCWGNSYYGSYPDNWPFSHTLDSPSSGEFSFEASGLVPSEYTYLRIFATVTDGTASSYYKRFSTRDLIDLDHDGMADDWEIEHFGSSTAVNASDDWDNDGVSNENEYWSGTNPKDINSCLRIEQMLNANNQTSIQWQSASNALYSVEYCTNLSDNSWFTITEPKTSTPPENSETFTSPDANGVFYRIRGERTDR